MNPRKNILTRYNKINMINTNNSNTNTSSISLTNSSSLASITLNNTFISSTFSTTTYAPYFSFSSAPLVDVEVLGKKFEIYPDYSMQVLLAQIDYLGIDFYLSLKKNNINISNKEIIEYLEQILLSKKREKKINDIIENL